MASVRVKQLIKNYGAVRAVNQLDLEVEDGEFMVFLGPSGCGKTTLLRALARLLAQLFEVTEQSMVPDPSLSIRERAIAAWPPAWHGQNQRDILVTLGYDVDIPWRDLPKKQRDWILFTEEQPVAPVYAGFTPAETRAALRRKEEPSYMGTFSGARRYVLHTFATTQSAMMKKRVARYMVGTVCPVCDGKRLKREALSVTFAGLDIGALSQLSLSAMADALRPAAEATASETEDNSSEAEDE